MTDWIKCSEVPCPKCRVTYWNLQIMRAREYCAKCGDNEYVRR